jgi:ring-1,2-phenylacetyl-CoA epoxidase subunit PaaD
MVAQQYTKEDIFGMLSDIPDPEIPVVNIYEMGMLRDVIPDEQGYEIILTPTYTGCPAMGIIEMDILATLNQQGVKNARVKMVMDPAWTTDWMSDEAKEKLRIYGIAPPLHSSCHKDVFDKNIIECPRCQSHNTVMLSRFGATACKALYQCSDCKEPFEYFKCH